MQQLLHKNILNKIAYHVLVSLILIESQVVFAGTFSVQGNVTASSTAVVNARVIFTDVLDTSVSYSTLTDSIGNYQLSVSSDAVISQNNLPDKFDLEQNYPNPFSSSTTIPYEINNHTKVNLTIYDLLGREVRKIYVGTKPVGSYKVFWDGRNNVGQKVATGIYIYRLEAGGEFKVRKMLYSAGGEEIIAMKQTSPSQLAKASQATAVASLEREYTVLIENMSDTYPQIVTLQPANVLVQSDTTLNFAVTKIPEAIIDMDNVYQYIRGFGAANIMPWRADMTDSEIQTAFGTGDGQLGFSMLRLRLPSGTGWDFSIQVATAKKAYDMGVLVFASPWSPPASLKSNNNTTGGYLLESNYQSFVDHLNSFIDYMSDNGVPLYAVSVQNEPDIEVTYESCDYTPDQMKNFMANYAGGIKTKVIAPESFQFRKLMSDPILNDSTACANLDIVGGHIYGGGLESYPLAEQKGKEIWMTEHLTNNNIFPMPWSEALAIGTEINNCMNAGMSAYIWWYIVRFYGPISDGEHNGTKGTITKKGYVMSQFSRFIRPGYHRVDCTKSPQRNISTSAYMDSTSSKVVIVALNVGAISVRQTFTLSGGNATAVIPYTTTQTRDCERGEAINVSEGIFTVTLEPSSITTFVAE